MSAEGQAYLSAIGDILGDDQRSVADRMALAIGAANAEEFARTGSLMVDLLAQYGFDDTSDLVDVGCGSGRLVSQLGGSHVGRYLGTDISAELVAHARSHFGGPHRSFQLVDDLRIPAEEETFDVACFFSVLTHLRHEESYLYLAEARRVLRPGGRIVASFLDFRQRDHWAVFGGMIARRANGVTEQVDQFTSVDALHAWAELADLTVVDVLDGMTPHIRVRDGSLATLGQSIVVLAKPVPTAG